MTMKTPEMEVVRFNESDVIVASGDAVTAVFDKFNDGTPKNATINGSSVQSYEDMLGLLGDQSGSWFKYMNNDPVNAKDLLDEEESGKLGNGTYVDQGKVTIGDTTYERLWWNQ